MGTSQLEPAAKTGRPFPFEIAADNSHLRADVRFWEIAVMLLLFSVQSLQTTAIGWEAVV